MSDIISSIDWELVLLLLGPISGIVVFLYLWWEDLQDKKKKRKKSKDSI